MMSSITVTLFLSSELSRQLKQQPECACSPSMPSEIFRRFQARFTQFDYTKVTQQMSSVSLREGVPSAAD